MRLYPGAIGDARRAPGARQRADLRHQRQDHHRHDGRRRSSSERASRSCTTTPAPTWPAGSPPRCSAPRARADAIAGELGLFEVDEMWLDSLAAELQPARDPARQPVPRPARPLRRARDDRRALGGSARRARPRRLVLNADDPLIADLGREHPGRVVLRRRGRLARAGGHGARRRRQALPPLRRAVRLRRRLPRPPRPLPLPGLRPVAARAGRDRAATCACRACARRASRCARPPGEAEVSARPSRPLQRLQRARRRGARKRAGGAAGDDRRRAGSTSRRGVRAGRSTPLTAPRCALPRARRRDASCASCS